MLVVPDDAVVVLDVDDTLYLESSYVRSGFGAVGRYLANRFGAEGVAETLWSGFEAGVRGDAFDRALMAHGIESTPGLVGHLVERYRNHEPEIDLLADAAHMIERLAARRVPLAVITDGPIASQRAKVDALGLRTIAEPVILTSELGQGHAKPDPLPYLTVEQRLEVAPDRCWYIGDNPAKDFVTPVSRGWTPVRIRRAGSLHAAIDTPNSVIEIETLDDLGC